MPAFTLEDVRAAGPRLLLVCVDVRDPGNAGTVVRSAWAAGVDALVCCEGTVDVYNPKAVRAFGRCRPARARGGGGPPPTS